jgi:hypothetical protein
MKFSKTYNTEKKIKIIISIKIRKMEIKKM